MIEFADFDVQDTPRYLEHVRKCAQITDVLSPFMQLALKEMFRVKRGYAEGLCWTEGVYFGEEGYAVPAGDWRRTDWADVFRKHVPAGTRFLLVPSYAVDMWRSQLGESILAEETDPKEWDYILSTERMESFASKKLQSFRKKCRAFEREYDYSIEPITPQIFPELREFHKAAEENIRQRHGESEYLELDDYEFYKALEYWEKLDHLFGFVVRVGGKIAAYNIDEVFDEIYSMGHFMKADYSYNGVNQFAYWYDAKSSLERGILIRNIMGVDDEGLRMFKEHLDPLVILKKYHVTYLP